MGDERYSLFRKHIHFIFILVLAIAIIFMFNFVIALPSSISSVFNSNTSQYINYTHISGIVNEDVGHMYNLTINHTASSSNVTNITVYFWGNFNFSDFFYGGNFSAAPHNATGNVTEGDQDGYLDTKAFVTFSGIFYDESLINDHVMWNGTNFSNYIFPWNETRNINASYFWFNATAYTPGKYNMTIRIAYEDTITDNSNYTEINMTVHINDTTVPVVDPVNFSDADGLNRSVTNNAVGNYSDYLLLNISLGDNGGEIRSVFFNISYNDNLSTNGSHWWFQASNLSTSPNWWHYNLDTNYLPDGFYNVSVIVNDSNGNINSTAHINITIDNTDPSGEMVCSPTDAYIAGTITCTCTSSDDLSGVSSTTYTSSPSTSNAGTDLTQTCTITDLAGNTGTAISNKYTIWGSPDGGTPSTSKPVTKTTTINEIIPGTPKVITSLDSSTNVREITIEVSSIASNVQVNVNKYDSKPSAVSVSKSGVYKYLQITTQNLENKLSKATMKVYVEKTWVDTLGINKEDVALFKYDETGNEWNELTTVYDSEDSTYYYYTIELTSFSYFSIAPKEGVEYEELPSGEEEEQLTELSIWVWIILGLVALMIIVILVSLIKKKKK